MMVGMMPLKRAERVGRASGLLAAFERRIAGH